MAHDRLAIHAAARRLGGIHEEAGRHLICNYVGGIIPFARTVAERQATRDPRPSLEERYGSHAGYVAAVRKAAARAVAQGFLLPEDAADLISLVEASHVLR